MQKIKEFLSQVTVVDTETTGVIPDDSEVIELATGRFYNPWSDGRPEQWNILNTLIKPLHPIPPEASSVNYISNRMVENQPIFDELLEVFDEMMYYKDTTFMIAHNADFDRKMIESQYGRCFAFDKFEPFNAYP